MILPKISLITPTLNSGKYLEETIKSVISQNYPNLEYIIIDGGSTDNTVEIIKKYSQNLTYWISEPDKGMYDAINKGFNKSSGEIMAWINSDDLFHNGALLCVGKIFKDLGDVDWIIGKSCLFNSHGICVKINETQYWSVNRIYTGDYRWIQQENVFWRRSLYNKVGAELNTSLKLAGDFELWMRFFKYSTLITVDTSFAGFRLHGHQLSINEAKLYEEEVLKIIDIYSKKSFKILIGKFLYNTTRRIDDSKNRFVLTLKLLIQLYLKRFNKYPAKIYYDFTEDIWKR